MIFGEGNHKVAEFIFLTTGEMQEQRQKETGPKPADFDTDWEAVGSSWGSRRAGTAAESPKDTEWFILPGGRQRTRPPTPAPAALLPTQGQQHWAEGGGNRGSSCYPFAAKTTPLRNHRGRDE